MGRLLVVGALAAAMLAPAAAGAQSALPISAEVHGSLGIPTGRLADEAKVGVGYGLSARLDFIPVIAAYVGYDRLTLGDITDDGYGFGAEVHLQLGGMATGYSPWARIGGIWNRAAFDRSGGATTLRTGRTLGLEVGAGLRIPLGEVLEVSPAIRYRRYSPDENLFGSGTRPDVTYFTADLGLTLTR